MSTATVQPASLMNKLNSEWSNRFADRALDFGLPEPITGAELIHVVMAQQSADRDEWLYPMLVAARAGNRAAERALVQLLIPVARRMAHRVSSLSDFDWGDRISVAIVTSWETIRSYELRRQNRVWANLTMELLKALSPRKTANDLQIADKTFPVDHDVLAAVVETAPPAERSPESRLATMFTWAVDTGVLTREEVALLSRVALGDETRAQVAKSLGSTEAAIQKRVHRIRERLSAAVREAR